MRVATVGFVSVFPGLIVAPPVFTSRELTHGRGGVRGGGGGAGGTGGGMDGPAHCTRTSSALFHASPRNSEALVFSRHAPSTHGSGRPLSAAIHYVSLIREPVPHARAHVPDSHRSSSTRALDNGDESVEAKRQRRNAQYASVVGETNNGWSVAIVPRRVTRRVAGRRMCPAGYCPAEWAEAGQLTSLL